MFFNAKKNEIQEVSVEDINPNPDQPRRVFSEKELIELSDSIKKIGVLQPIIAKRINDKTFHLIAGERRWRAAKLAGLSKVPVIIKEINSQDMALWSLVENIQRENLNFIEEAYAYKNLVEVYQLTQKEIADTVGKNQSTVSNKMRLLNLPEEIQRQLLGNGLTERHARAFLKIPDHIEIHNVLNEVVDKNLNVYETELLIESVIKDHGHYRKKTAITKHIHYNIYINTLKKAFNTIKEVEKNAEYNQSDNGNYMEITIRIPKSETKKSNPSFT